MVAQRPFVDRPVGDPESANALAVRVADEFGLTRPSLLRTGMNALFRAGDVVIRVGRPSAPAELGTELADRLRDRGIPVPEPAASGAFVADGLAATCWRAVRAVDVPIDWRGVGSIVAEVHRLGESDLPPGYPVPSPTTFPWWDFDAMMDDVGGELDPAARHGLVAAIDRNRGWTQQSETVICHGDVHPGNVMMSVEGPVLLDWDLMCRAHRGWDHSMLLTLAQRWGGDPLAYLQFADGYGESLADDPVTMRFAELRNVAASLMRVRAGRTDAAARAEAERRLRYWRGDADAPAWRAQ